MSNEVHELIHDIESFPITVVSGPPVNLDAPLAQHLHELGYRKRRTITTVEELDTLPGGSAVLDADRDVSTKHADRWHGYEMAPLDSRKFSKYGPFTVLHEPEPTP